MSPRASRAHTAVRRPTLACAHESCTYYYACVRCRPTTARALPWPTRGRRTLQPGTECHRTTVRCKQQTDSVHIARENTRSRLSAGRRRCMQCRMIHAVGPVHATGSAARRATCTEVRHTGSCRSSGTRHWQRCRPEHLKSTSMRHAPRELCRCWLQHEHEQGIDLTDRDISMYMDTRRNSARNVCTRKHSIDACARRYRSHAQADRPSDSCYMSIACRQQAPRRLHELEVKMQARP
jgi:hypothetical protein